MWDLSLTRLSQFLCIGECGVFFYYLFIGCTGFHCCVGLFSSCGEGGYSLAVVLTLYYGVSVPKHRSGHGGFSSCVLWNLPQSRMNSMPCIGRQTLNLWTTRKPPQLRLKLSSAALCPWPPRACHFITIHSSGDGNDGPHLLLVRFS